MNTAEILWTTKHRASSNRYVRLIDRYKMLLCVLLLVNCLQVVYSLHIGCHDLESFCSTVTPEQCKLNLAQQRCPRTCNACGDTPLLPDSLNAETWLFNCLMGHASTFCYNMINVCCRVVGMTCQNIVVRELPQTVASCIYSNDPVMICKAKYDDKFCNELGGACSELTGTPIPHYTNGAQYRLPQLIANCIAQEDFVPVCYAKYTASLCTDWMRACNIGVWPGRLDSTQNSCMQSQEETHLMRQKCVTNPSLEFCRQFQTTMRSPPQTTTTTTRRTTTTTRRTTTTKPPTIVTDIVFVSCKEMFGAENCNRWLDQCRRPDAPLQNLLDIPQRECLKSQMTIDSCKRKYGSYCKDLQDECLHARRGVIIVKDEYGAYQLASSTTHCINNGGVLATCIRNHNVTVCNKWYSKCSEVFKVNKRKGYVTTKVIYSKMTPGVALCISSQDVMRSCASKRGFYLCKRIVKKCARIFNPASRTLPSLYLLGPGVVDCLARNTIRIHSQFLS